MSSELTNIKNGKKLLAKKRRKIVRSGRSSHLPLGKELKNIVDIGDEFDTSYYLENGKLVIHAVKTLGHFSLDDIRNIANKNNFKVIDDKTIGDVRVFQATSDSITINGTHDLNTQIVNITIFCTKPVSNYIQYEKLKKHVLVINPDAIIQPQGDLDVVNVLEDPSQYNLDFKKAFLLLQKAKKKIGLTVIFKFDSKTTSLPLIEQALEKFPKFVKFS